MITECKEEALPEDLQEEIRQLKKSISENSSVTDCWLGEIASSTNQYYVCKVISKEVYDWLYENYIFGKGW